MNKTSSGNKCKEYRNSAKIVLPKPIDHSASSNKQAKKHESIMASFRPNSEMPGNDR